MSASSFKAITVVALDDTTVDSTTVAETDYTAWSNVTTYAVGAFVIRAETHRIYTSRLAANLNKTPEDEPLYWTDAGPTNAYAMFDYDISTATASGASSLVVVLAPGAIDALYVDGVIADTVEVQVLDEEGGSEIYSESQTMASGTISAWVGEFADPSYTRTAALFAGIPAVAGCVVTVTFTGTNVVVASLAVGRTDTLGTTEQGVQSSINSFSRITTDEDFGTRTFTRRGYSRRMEGQLTVPNSKAAKVFQILAGLEATPAVYCGTDSLTMDPLKLIGYCQTFSLDWRTATLSYISFTVEGL